MHKQATRSQHTNSSKQPLAQQLRHSNGNQRDAKPQTTVSDPKGNVSLSPPQHHTVHSGTGLIQCTDSKTLQLHSEQNRNCYLEVLLESVLPQLEL